jgi:hypothetical protein
MVLIKTVFYLKYVFISRTSRRGKESKSTTYFFNILEKKMLGVETTPLPGPQGTFCQGRGGVPPPVNKEYRPLNSTYSMF